MTRRKGTLQIIAISALALANASCLAQNLYGPWKSSDKGETLMRIEPRYHPLTTEEGVEEAERNYHHRTLVWDMPLAEAALVCVDCWNWHFSRDTRERIERITRERIAPLIEACRRHGMLVIHAPADPVATRHPNWIRLKPKDAKPQPQWPDSPDWPPKEFKEKTGPYAKYAKPGHPQLDARALHRETKRDFHPLCQPVGDEPVILDGEELHRLCARRGILHLFYVGFNTNACIMMRDYGLQEMSRRGYDVILVRDCTTGMETAETAADMACTRGTICTIEQFIGYTVSSDELIEALKNAR